MPRTCCSLLSAALLVPLTACGPASSLPPPPVPGNVPETVSLAGEDRSIERLLVEVPVTKRWAQRAEWERPHLEAILEGAKKANPGGRIAGVLLLTELGGWRRQARVAFDAHRIRDRVRSYHSIHFVEVGGSGSNNKIPPARRWKHRDEGDPLDLNLEVCPAWRSFLVGSPPLPEENLHLWIPPDVPEPTLLALLDVVWDHVEDGERIWMIDGDQDWRREFDRIHGIERRPGTEVFEVQTTNGSGSGRLLRVEHRDGDWTVEL